MDKGSVMKRTSRTNEWIAFFATAAMLSLASCAHRGDDDLARSGGAENALADLPSGAVNADDYSAGAGETMDIDETMATEMAANDTQPPLPEDKVEDKAPEPEAAEENPFNDLAAAEVPPMEMAPTPLPAPEAIALTEAPVEPVAITETPERPRRSRAKGAVAMTPTIPSDAFQTEGVRMNRYYVLRQGDTPPSVSKLIFGHPNRAAELLSLAGGTTKWRAGEVMFYSSPDSPEDVSMKSFYSERGVKLETHAVAAGETLASIAKSRYGSARSWREIAALNQLPSAQIEKGATLALLPTELGSYNREEWAINNAKAPEPTKPAERTIAAEREEALSDFDPSSEETTVAAAPGSPEVMSAPPVPDEFNPRAGLGSRPMPKNAASFAMSGFLRQNMLLLLIAGLVGLSALYFLVILPNRTGY